ncbi:hypothetical protein [Spongiimicrobium salis]
MEQWFMLIIPWGSQETEKGKTVYHFTTDGTVEVEDYFLTNDTYHLFGKA